MNLSAFDLIIVIILTVWTVVWKIYSVWNAAKHNNKKWFILLLLLNTAGILDMIYIFKILKKDTKEVKKDFNRALAVLKN